MARISFAPSNHGSTQAGILNESAFTPFSITRPVRGKHFALILFDFFGFQGKGRKDIGANVVGCGL
jgi:hypothetical protein